MNPLAALLTKRNTASEEGKRVLNFARIVNDGATSTTPHVHSFPLKNSLLTHLPAPANKIREV
ncbi:Uncharacterized protein APZ42_013417 [Daphnia magna]|uniref:Uncharacterized protein n=1 Tax=Daphnia magna TaxID=35525 RepID=A0A162QZQ9_9CRUS|nr:Uncharacterized protein APZ42_013417 [Daphnia magna]